MPVIPFNGSSPAIAENVFIAPDAWVIGDVHVEANATILFGVILRGDILPLYVGEGSNVQEHTVFHTTTGQTPTRIGKNVTIGHSAVLHGCDVSDHCIIGMHSTLLDGAQIPPYCIVAANSLVPLNFKGEEGSLILGSPAKVVRRLKPEERRVIEESANHYREKGREYREIFK